LPQMGCGMDGVISVAANSFPREFSDMIRLCLKQDFAAAKKINDKLIDAYHLMFEENNPAGVKAFLFEMGLLENVMRLPVTPLSGVLHQGVKKYLNK
jgi:4-hydroxy-tetrahydrodipicolinate synthase